MTFLVTSTNTGDISHLVDEEFARVDQLRASGALRQGWVKSDMTGAVLLLESADRDDAVATLATLPSVASGLTYYSITEIVDLDSVR